MRAWNVTSDPGPFECLDGASASLSSVLPIYLVGSGINRLTDSTAAVSAMSMWIVYGPNEMVQLGSPKWFGTLMIWTAKHRPLQGGWWRGSPGRSSSPSPR